MSTNPENSLEHPEPNANHAVRIQAVRQLLQHIRADQAVAQIAHTSGSMPALRGTLAAMILSREELMERNQGADHQHAAQIDVAVYHARMALHFLDLYGDSPMPERPKS